MFCGIVQVAERFSREGREPAGKARAAFPAFSGREEGAGPGLRRTTPAAWAGSPPTPRGAGPSWSWGGGGGGNERSRESAYLARPPPPASAVAAGDCGSLRASRSPREVSLLFPLPSPKVGVRRGRARAGGWPGLSASAASGPAAVAPGCPGSGGGAPLSLAPARPGAASSGAAYVSRPSGGRHVRSAAAAAARPASSGGGGERSRREMRKPSRRAPGCCSGVGGWDGVGWGGRPGLCSGRRTPCVPAWRGAGAGRARYTRGRGAEEEEEEGGAAFAAPGTVRPSAGACHLGADR